MKVFVAGATGVLGRRAVAQLVAVGHDVTGVARTPAKAALLRRLGATPVTVDLFDPAALKDAVAGHDAVLNLATHIPPMTKAAMPGAWSENDRIRTEASRNLVDGALAAGATRYVQESICFPYTDRGAEWIDEDTPLDLPSFARSTSDAEAQAARFTDSGGTGVVLRFGQFHAAESAHTIDMLRAARARLSPSFGDPEGYVPTIHADDAASAVVAALGAPAGVYNVVDDEPVSRREHGRSLARALGVKPPRHLPAAAAKVGGSKTALLARSQRVSNAKFKQATGWAPEYPSVREAWSEIVAASGGPVVPDLRRTAIRIALAVLAVSGVVLGVWAAFAPRSFYADFPGGGRTWVSADGPYNEHLVRDFGALNLALALVLAVAAVKLTPVLVRTAAAAAVLFALPHFVYHLRHLDVYDTSDKIGNAFSLALAVALPLLVLWLSRRMRSSEGAVPSSV